MPAKNPRINITLEEATAGYLAQLALREEKSVASLARELILEALDRREDMALSTLADQRDHLKVQRINHEDVWN